jgi:hypothetical protein
MGLLEVVKGRGFGSQKRLSQFLSNPNQTTINKNVKKAEISRDTHRVQMTTHASFFADQENNMYFQPRMRLKKGLNTRGSLQEQIKN